MLGNDAFGDLILLVLFLLALLVEQKLFAFFLGDSRSVEPRLVGPVRLDVVVDALEALEAFQELIRFVSIAEM